MKELRMLIRELREDRDIKQKVIAEYLGISQQTYYKVSTDYLLGANTAYLGNTNLREKYLGDVTIHDVVFDLQKLNTKDRRDLLRYIRFLENGES